MGKTEPRTGGYVALCIYMDGVCDMAQDSNSVLPLTCLQGTRHLIELFRGIILSVDVWKDDHCVSA